MRRFIASSAALACLAVMPVAANAEVVIVDALANSSTGGVGKATSFVFASGSAFRVRSRLNDLWSAGAPPRQSNGNGLTGNIFATAGDDSGQAPGTLIGVDFGTHTQDGFTAPFGSLVGRFGGVGGVYQLLGANFDGTAAGSGALDLFYWDSNNGDNTGSISFNVLAGVPEPMTWALMILGFGVVGGAMRRRTGTAAVRVSYS